MTVLLVLLTLILFLVFDHVVEKRRIRKAARTAADVFGETAIQLPNGVALASNHMWMRTNHDGTLTIGFDGWLSRLLGVAERVVLPQAGDESNPSHTAITVGARGRSLQLAVPSAGTIVDMNGEVLRNPSLILKDPYGKGWILKVRSGANVAADRFLVRHPAAWLREQLVLVRDFIAHNSKFDQQIVMQEGGLPREGALQQFDQVVWTDFANSFVSLRKVSESISEETQS